MLEGQSLKEGNKRKMLVFTGHHRPTVAAQLREGVRIQCLHLALGHPAEGDSFVEPVTCFAF